MIARGSSLIFTVALVCVLGVATFGAPPLDSITTLDISPNPVVLGNTATIAVSETGFIKPGTPSGTVFTLNGPWSALSGGVKTNYKDRSRSPFRSRFNNRFGGRATSRGSFDSSLPQCKRVRSVLAPAPEYIRTGARLIESDSSL
jgi:hypothetical protein